MRFLLSNPKPEKSVCLAKGTLAQAVEFISDSMVDLDGGGNNNDCDLFVSETIDQDILEQAYNTLKPGGNLYLEWSVIHRSQIAPTLELLNSKGFKGISTYVPKPDPSEPIPPNTWIPLGSRSAAELLMTKYNNITYTTRTKRIVNYLRRLLWKIYPMLFITYPWLLTSSLRRFPLCTVAHKPIDMITEAKREHSFDKTNRTERENLDIILRENWEKWGLGEKPKDLYTLTLTVGTSSYSKIISIPFDGTDCEPKLIIKFPRIKESALFISNEASVLSELNEKDYGIEGIPRVLDTLDNFGYTTVIQTFIRGTPAQWIINKQNFRKIALLATSWLVDLAIKTKSVPPKNWHKNLVQDVLTDLTANYHEIIPPAMIQKTEDILSDLEIPFLICEHRDFYPMNVHYDSDGNFGVVDWERSRIKGLPGIDIITFLKNLSVYMYPDQKLGKEQENYRLMLDETSDTGKVFKECLDIYTSELGITTSAVARLRLLSSLNSLHWKYCIQDLPENTELISIPHYKFWEQEIMLSNYP